MVRSVSGLVQASARVRGQATTLLAVIATETEVFRDGGSALLVRGADTVPRWRGALDWTEGSPLIHFLRFILWGSGEVAPVTREILRRAEPDRSRRPHVHAG